jgi:hypothetical protein
MKEYIFFAVFVGLLALKQEPPQAKMFHPNFVEVVNGEHSIKNAVKDKTVIFANSKTQTIGIVVYCSPTPKANLYKGAMKTDSKTIILVNERDFIKVDLYNSGNIRRVLFKPKGTNTEIIYTNNAKSI